MQTPSGASSPSDRAQQVCLSCKTRKRKCDKLLPRCSQCTKRGSTCQYSKPNENRTPQSTSDVSRDHFYPPNYGLPRAQCLDFSTVLFLDPDVLHLGQLDTTGVFVAVPQHVLKLLGSIDDIQYSASNFFTTIHTWMPLVPKKRFYDVYLRSAFQSRADLVLLFLAVKLITTPPPTHPRDARTQLYNDTKHFYLEVEGSSIFSISVLQAGILIALYELGHGIYPAAYLSVGACARYAHAMGITSSNATSSRRILNLIELEERRRVWWAVVILDRFVGIGCPGKPFATTEPSINDSFPADDAEWDEEVVRRDPCYTLSSPNVTHMSRFSLLCQAARILGQVLEAVSNAAEIQEDAWKQLEITLNSMLSAALNIESPGFCQIAFIYSSLIALYKPYIDNDTPNDPLSRPGRAILEEVTMRIKENILQREWGFDLSPDNMSPWGLFFTYQICAFHLRAGRDDEAVGPLRNSLSRLDARWKAASKYMQLLEAQEILIHSDQRAQ